MLVLHDLTRSGNCYKIRLLLSLLDLPYERVLVDTQSGAHRTPEFLALNPRGQVPVLVDDGTAIWDSTAILAYLGRRYGGDTWLPLDPIALAKVMQWLALEQNEGRYGVARARAVMLKNPTVFARTGRLDECQALAQIALHVLEQQLTRSPWLVAEAGRPTIADVACYPYTAMAPEGGIDLTPFPAIRTWIERIQRLPRYIQLPGATTMAV